MTRRSNEVKGVQGQAQNLDNKSPTRILGRLKQQWDTRWYGDVKFTVLTPRSRPLDFGSAHSEQWWKMEGQKTVHLFESRKLSPQGVWPRRNYRRIRTVINHVYAPRGYVIDGIIWSTLDKIFKLWNGVRRRTSKNSIRWRPVGWHPEKYPHSFVDSYRTRPVNVGPVRRISGLDNENGEADRFRHESWSL